MKPEQLTELMRTTMRDNPRASQKEIRDLCRSKMCSESLIDALFEYWFSNSYRDFVVQQIAEGSIAVFSSVNSRDRERGTRTTDIGQQVEAAKNRMRSCLMDHILSDGTALRFATFGQCAVEGGWLSAIAKRGNPNEIVGKKLTEIDLRNLRMRNERAA